MKKVFVIANWKMNPNNLAQAKQLFDSTEKKLKKIKINNKVETIICPPFIYLGVSKNDSYRLGAQDMFWEDQGAFTGEISGKMIQEMGCKYVLIGHSERRNYNKETNLETNKKILSTLKNNLKPILCIGEKRGEEMSLVVKKQIIEGLENVNKAQLRDLIIAYEPIWAIGTGSPCSPDDAMRAMLFIRRILKELYNRKLAEEVPILYGGSVTSKIASDYIKEAGLNGLLVGGASLDSTEFSNIIENIL